MEENHDDIIKNTQGLNDLCKHFEDFLESHKIFKTDIYDKLEDIAGKLISLETEVRVKERIWSWLIGIGVPTVTFFIGLFWSKR